MVGGKFSLALGLCLLIGCVQATETDNGDDAVDKASCYTCTDGEDCLSKDDTMKACADGEVCYVYQYIDVTNGAIMTTRGCNATTYCDDQSTLTNGPYVACNVATDATNTSADITDTTKYCISCVDEACNKLTKDSYTPIVADNNICIVYQYGDQTANKTSKEANKTCADIYNNETTKASLISCYECTVSDDKNLCNLLDIKEIQQDRTCIACSSESDGNCIDATSKSTCYTDDVVQTACYTKVYLKDNSSIVTERGCANDVCSNPTELVISCKADKAENSNNETTPNFCIECEGVDGTCELSKDHLLNCESSCVAYTSFKDGTSHFNKGCNSCSKLLENSTVSGCESCNASNTNLCDYNYTTINETLLVCYDNKCDDCKSNFTSGEYCHIEKDKGDCFSYSYVDSDSKSHEVYGCASTTSYCDDLIKNMDSPKDYTGTLKTCGHWSKSMSNKQLNSTEIVSGATFSTVSMWLLSVTVMLRHLL